MGYNFILFFNIGMPELIIILLVVLLLFGASRLPKLAKSIALSIREFKDAQKELDEDKKNTSGRSAKKKKSSGTAEMKKGSRPEKGKRERVL